MMRRPVSARVGLVLLNLAAPGLGLLRLGPLRPALPWLLAPVALLLLLAPALSVAPTPRFSGFVTLGAVLLLVSLVLLVVPAALTWRRSRELPEHLPWWSRWYALILVAVAISIVNGAALNRVHGVYKPFYASSESMAPTILAHDKLIADMRGGRDPTRGDVVLVTAHGQIRIVRVAALAGDRFAMREGAPVINGRIVAQAPAGRILLDGSTYARRFTEQLPGEQGIHHVIDMGYQPALDEMEERRVPLGYVFVLGDNRDRAADSRVPIGLMGVDMVPVSAIAGRPLYIHWSTDRARIGTPLNLPSVP